MIVFFGDIISMKLVFFYSFFVLFGLLYYENILYECKLWVVCVCYVMFFEELELYVNVEVFLCVIWGFLVCLGDCISFLYEKVVRF